MNNLKDLKKAGLQILIPLVIVTMLALTFSTNIINFILTYYGLNTIAITITESFEMQIKFSLVIAGIFLLPLITNAVYNFIKPAYELKNSFKTLVVSQVLALGGFILGMTYFSKTIMSNLNSFTISTGYYSLSNILSFGIGIGFAVALSLQLIILIPILNNLKVVNYQKLWKSGGVMLVTAYFVSAFITPSDLTSTFMVMLPLSFSYVTGIGISAVQEKKK